MATHAPKRASIDLDTMINHDTKGQEYPLDTAEVTPFGLFFARRVFEHERLSYQQSWLLPAHGLRVSDFTTHPHVTRDLDHYVDVAEIHQPAPGGPRVWGWTDHYLDLAVRTGRSVDLLDADEFVQAVAAGLLPAADAERSLDRAAVALAGIAAHGHDVVAWLASVGVRLTWPGPPTPT